jgi:hypothetical protein
MNDKLEHAIALLHFGRFAPLHRAPLLFYACVLVLLVLVLWLFVASKKGRAAAARRTSEESARQAEISPSSDEQRAFLIKLEQEFEALQGGRVRKGRPETATSQTGFGNSVESSSCNGEPDLNADLNRAKADLRALNTLPAEVNVNLDDMCRQRDDALRERDDALRERDSALRERDDWRSQAEAWKVQAERLILPLRAPRSAAERPTLNAPRPALPGTTLEPPGRRSWWPWRRRAG